MESTQLHQSQLATRASELSSTVLITGESGTGKSHLAENIHYSSNRSRAAFVKINLATLNMNLLESELFGHEKGAFSSADQRKIGRIELANHGTLFLDEIGELPPSAQCKLLEFLQTKKIVRVGGNSEIPVNVRIIAATNRNLAESVEEKTFREDLYYRITTFPIHLNPIRERKNELIKFTEKFRTNINQEIGTHIHRISNECLKKINSYDWPGNLRELRNTLEFSFAMKKLGVLNSEDLILNPTLKTKNNCHQFYSKSTEMDFRKNKEEFEKRFLESALKHFNGKVNETARRIKISKVTLIEKIRRYEIDFKAYRSA